MKRPQPSVLTNENDKPVVSVVIPCYNYARYLPQAVSSVLSQTGVNVRILIVDDASTDDSATVAASLAAQDSRVQVIEHTKNAGHIATYNEGLAAADGDYVVLLSADDMLAPGSLERSTALLETHPDVGLVYGYAMDFTAEAPEAQHKSVGKLSWSVWSGTEWIGIMCRRGTNIIVNPEAVLRRSLMTELGGYRADMPHAADMDLWLRAASRANVGRINGPVQAYYRVHGANMHLTGFGNTMADISARREVFAALTVSSTATRPASRRYQHKARRALSREAARAAVLALDAGTIESRAEAAKLADFAVGTAPGIVRSGPWKTYTRRQKGSASPLSRSLASLADRWRWSTQWRRWRRYGI